MKLKLAVVLVSALAIGQLPLAAQGGSFDAVERALTHVRANHADFGVSAADVEHLRVTDAYRSAHTGAAHVYLAQELGGLEVAGATMTVTVLRDGTVFKAASRFLPDLAAAASGTVARDARTAVADAARALGLAMAREPRVITGPSGIERATLIDASDISRSPVTARLVRQPAEDGALRLAWNLEIDERSQAHWWNLAVDAEDGRLLDAYDYIVHERASDIAHAVARPSGRPVTIPAAGPAQTVNDGSSYRVFALPFESPNDGPRTLETNPADAAASPFGWHDVDATPGAEYTTTRGNNVWAYADVTGGGVEVPTYETQGGPGLTFDHPLDLSLPPHFYKDAAITNLFFWNNIIHDVFYHYGFDEPAGNFQEVNYDGLGGSGSDSVNAEGQDSAGINNANFGTPSDGSNPRMQMYLWQAPGRRILDGDLDAGVIIHEYGHGISNRLTGGPRNVSCLGNDEQAGEGWSDFLAIALTAIDGEEGRRGLGTYVSGESRRSQGGIRPRPYSTSIYTNNATYDSIKTATVPHGVGWVWASMLWQVMWELVDDHGFNPNPYDDWTTGGNNLVMQLVIDGMKMQPCRPGFVDSRDAILDADVVLTGGQNRCAIWRGFALRGLGVSATQGFSTSRSDGTQAFDLPAGCEEPPA